MKHVKENDLAHGQFGKWLKSIGMNWNVANRMMKVASEIGSNSDTYHNLGLNALYLIASLPEEAREKPHAIPSTGEVKTVDEMTVRELREVKKARKWLYFSRLVVYISAEKLLVKSCPSSFFTGGVVIKNLSGGITK